MATYESYQGEMFFADLDLNDQPGELQSAGNISGFEFSPELTTSEKYESRTGSRGLEEVLITQRNANFTFILDQLTNNMDIVLSTTKLTVPAQTSQEVTIEAVMPGAVYPFSNTGNTNVTQVVDANGTAPVTPYEIGTDFTVDEKFSLIRIVPTADGGNIPSGTTLTVTINTPESDQYDALTRDFVYKYIRFHGVNTTPSGSRRGEHKILTIPKAELTPPQGYQQIAEDFQSLTVNGRCLKVPGKSLFSEQRFDMAPAP